MTVWQLDFKETRHPTLIRTTEERDVAAQGSVWLNPEDGTVVRTRLFLSGFSGPGTTPTVEVTFARDTRLTLWLPAAMTERYEGLMRGPGTAARHVARPVLVTAAASYGEFKRFETSATFSIK